MIEVRKEPTNGEVVKQETPTRITTEMIQNDLENGITRDNIQEKYNLEKWMITQMFQHPELKGRKAKKVRKLPFEFIDNTSQKTDSNQLSIEDTGYDSETMQVTAKVELIDGTTVEEEVDFEDDTDIEY